MSLLEARRLGLRVGDRQLVAGLDWTARAGEFWCVLGPNGVGKSSLLHAVAGLQAPGEGELRIDGRPIGAIDPLALARLRGLMPQHTVDSFSCPVRDAVEIALTPWRLGRGWTSAEEDRRVQAALAAVGMHARAEDDLTRLSGGERQRVAFAAMLAQAPALMLFDEPTAHQDVAQQLLLMRLMQQQSARHAVVASCHDINLAARFASHLLLLGPDFHRAGTVAEVLQPELLGRAFGCRFRREGGMLLAD